MPEETSSLRRDDLLLILLSMTSGRSDKDELRGTISALLDGAGQRYEFVSVYEPKALSRLAQAAAHRVSREGGALVAAGGDGTIRTVAAEAHRYDCLFGVIPQGTFNYFARAERIPQDAAEATHALLNAKVREVQVGLMSGKVFLVSASLGLYPELIQEREEFKRRFGRSRPVALGAALFTLFREHRQLAFSIEHDGTSEQRRSRTLVVSNNPLQLERVGMIGKDVLADGKLVAITLGRVDSLDLLGLLLRGTLGLLGHAEKLNKFSFRRLEVRPGRRYGRRRLKVALDGEVTWQRSPVVFTVADRRLKLLVPSGDIGNSP